MFVEREPVGHSGYVVADYALSEASAAAMASARPAEAGTAESHTR